jgi:phosphoglycerol transferase MdoB-like AlkP superfamily enzyme
VELLQGKPTQAQNIFTQATCGDEAVRGLPVFSLGPRITLLQVESLDYSAINARAEGRVVAPVLSAMAKEALFLEIDGTKRLGSANSDYELLNTKVAREEVLYYAYLTEFPDSLILLLKRHGYETAVFHGVNGRYMSLRRAYAQMGFSKHYFKEELIKIGYQANPLLFMEQVPDGPLLDFAAGHARSPGPFLHFIITITMHANAPPEFSGGFSSHSYFNALSYFDAALGRYLEALEEGDSVIVYGDHQSYGGPERSGTVPFLIYTKGKPLASTLPAKVVYSRCEMSHYLRALFEASCCGASPQPPGG